jgi:hypothetical protein
MLCRKRASRSAIVFSKLADQLEADRTEHSGRGGQGACDHTVGTRRGRPDDLMDLP